MNTEHRTPNLRRASLAIFYLLFAVFAAATARAANWGYNITNNTLNGVDLTFYQSNSPGNYTFETEQFLGAGANSFLTNSAISQATNGIALQFTNQNSFSQIGYLSKIAAGTVKGGTLTGCNVSVLLTNYFSQFTMPAYASAAPSLGGSAGPSTNAPGLPSYLLSGQTGAGYFAPVVSMVAVANTNDLYATGAGTSAANAHYHLQGPAFTAGFIYSNVLATAGTPNGFICGQFGGTQAPDYDQMPIYMGATTNNYSTDTGAGGYWYFSVVAPNAYWSQTTSYIGPGTGSGVNPPPTVVYGTNYISITNEVFFSQPLFAGAFSNNVLYVSKSGNDVLASNLVCAFASCNAAKNFAAAGDTICVAAGWYEDRDLLKNGVDWSFDKNSVIGWDTAPTDMNPRSIFDDYAGAVTSSISGGRIHFTGVSPTEWPAILVTNPLSRLVIKFDSADFAQYNVALDNSAVANAPQAIPTASGLFSPSVLVVANCQYVSCDIDSVNGWTNGIRRYFNGNFSLVEQVAPNAFGLYAPVTNCDGGFVWGGGETHIHLHSLIVTNAGGLTVPPYAFESGNDNATETSVFFSSDFVDGFAYWDDSNPNARTWLDVNYFQGVPGVPALRYYGNAVNYYRGEKVSATGSQCFDLNNLAGNNQSLWASVQKLTQNGNSSWVDGIAPGMHTWWNVLYFEDNSGGTMTSPGIQISGGTNFFFGGDAVVSNATVASVNGGQTTLQGMTLQAAGTNYDVRLFTSTGTNNLTLQNDVLHTANAAESIWATNLAGAWVSGSFMADVAPTNLVKMNGTTYSHTQTGL